MKIGFFGDSFCMELSNIHSEAYKYDTYLTMIKNHYAADIVNLGQGGSSVWDVIINQFPPHLNNLPDICIFCWTDYNRIFHRTFRSLTGGSVLNLKQKDITDHHRTQKHVFDAATHYFLNLYDEEKSKLELQAALHYFDDYVLSKIFNKTKIFHMWSFEKCYDWKYGNDILPALVSITRQPDENPKEDWGPNHLGNYNKNKKVFEIIKSAIG
jgi:hypothetical protein